MLCQLSHDGLPCFCEWVQLTSAKTMWALATSCFKLNLQKLFHQLFIQFWGWTIFTVVVIFFLLSQPSCQLAVSMASLNKWRCITNRLTHKAQKCNVNTEWKTKAVFLSVLFFFLWYLLFTIHRKGLALFSLSRVYIYLQTFTHTHI